MNPFTAPAFFAGLVLSLSLIMAIGPQNAHVIRSGIMRQHLWLTVAVCAVSDVVFIALGVAGLVQLGGLSAKLLGTMTGAGALVVRHTSHAAVFAPCCQNCSRCKPGH